MQVTSVRYERTHNLGDFCSVKAACEVQVDEGESPEEAMEYCKKQVHESIRAEINRKKGDK